MNQMIPPAGGQSSQHLKLNYWMMRLFLTSLLISVALINGFAYRGAAQVVTLRENNTPLRRILLEIREQTGYSFLIREELYKKTKPISIQLNNTPLNDALRKCLDGQNLAFVIHDEDKMIVISEKILFRDKSRPAGAEILENAAQRDSLITVSGSVSDSTGQFLAGATVKVPGRSMQTMTDGQGRFILQQVPANAFLEISYLGYKTERIRVSPRISVRLGQSAESMKEVVITGLFERKTESFTGSTTTFSQKELLQVGNLNVLKSLNNLDPSFRIMENLEFGSDPNRLEDIQLRGQTGLPDLNNEYGTNPNLPLFILDGFETNLQRVKDLDIYLVKSITLLKDAASKAVYGSRAANGVVVIETMRPPAGRLQINYNYNLNVELPDLSSYNLADPMQKLQIEMMTDSRLRTQNGALSLTLDTWREYDAKREEILRGVNTYWLSQPLRNGYGQRHSLTLGGGRDELQYSVEMGYNDIKGVMDGSQRNVYSGGIQLAYRKKSISVSNTLRLGSSRGDNSPYGSFQLFADQNPYMRLRGTNGNYEFSSPMYNGTVGVQDFTKETNVTNNTDLVWNIRSYLRLNGRLGLTRADKGTNIFLPASHNSFPLANTSGYYDSNTVLRGSYTRTNAIQNRLNTTLGLSFNKAFGRSTVYANLGADANSASTEDYGFKVVGFPNANLNFPAAAQQYAPNSRLNGTENKTRDIGFYSAVNYAYDDRYLADLSWRTTRSSQFGSDSPTAEFWSAGLGWNIHNEAFMKNNGVFNVLRITANTGFTGTQPVNAYLGYPVYRYQLDNLYFGQYSVELVAMANPQLGAQRKQDNSVSLNMTLFNNRLNLTTDYYVSYTDGLLIDINLPNSTGFSSFKANQGKVENRGIDSRVNFQAYRNTQKGDFVSVYATIGHNRNTLKELSNTLIALTSSQDKVMSSALKQRFEVGSSLNTIWAVKSLGIDPATGKEVFQKKDGSVTYDWDAADQIAAGDNIAKLYGNIGFNIRFSGWQLNTSFAYNLGGYKYNTTLLNKVENINRAKNVDARVFTSRWQKPGDATFFKSINDQGTTYPTTRFVEKWNELTMANINLSYDLDRLDFVKRAHVRRLRASLVMDTPFVLSTVGMERGTSYPFARTFSFTLQTNF